MKTMVKLGISICLIAGLSLAATTTQQHGKLIDAKCYNSATKAGKSMAVSCAPTASTVNFAFERGKSPFERHTKVYLLNPAGNTAAAAALRKGDLKPGHSGAYHVIVTGSRRGDTIDVQSIRGYKPSI